eukprot:NODE_255_length_12751_cov_0.188587.p5 type:complete len:236 gc:universal NODE_255_length_12751_cov_0.188587:11224-10517(-)
MFELCEGNLMGSDILEQEPSIFQIKKDKPHFGFVLKNVDETHVNMGLLSSLKEKKFNFDICCCKRTRKKESMTLAVAYTKNQREELFKTYKFSYYDTRLKADSFILPHHILLHKAEIKFIEVKKAKPASSVRFLTWFLCHTGFDKVKRQSEEGRLSFLDIVDYSKCNRLSSFRHQAVIISHNGINDTKKWSLIALINNSKEVFAVTVIEKDLLQRNGSFDDECKLKRGIYKYWDQ